VGLGCVLRLKCFVFEFVTRWRTTHTHVAGSMCHRARLSRTCVTSPAPCLAGFARDAVGHPGRRAEGRNHLKGANVCERERAEPGQGQAAPDGLVPAAEQAGQAREHVVERARGLGEAQVHGEAIGDGGGVVAGSVRPHVAGARGGAVHGAGVAALGDAQVLSLSYRQWGATLARVSKTHTRTHAGGV